MTSDDREDYPGELDEIRRHDLITKAVAAADRILCAGADGSVEEINWLTAMVAEAFVKKTTIAAGAAMMRKDLIGRR